MSNATRETFAISTCRFARCDALAKGCAIDLRPRVFKPGDCALTALARVRVTLRQVDDTPAYQVLVDRSYAQYLWDWLTDAALEFVSPASSGPTGS